MGLTRLIVVVVCLYAVFCVVRAASVYQMNQNIQQGKAPRTIIRIDAANPELFDRFIHAHFSDGGALYINGEWKHGGRLLTSAEKNWLKSFGWQI